jgi:Flp pilus assembly protein TadB
MKKNRKFNKNNRGKTHAKSNFFLLVAVIVGLCAYFTVKSLWNIGLVAVIVLLLFPTGLYFWLWKLMDK